MGRPGFRRLGKAIAAQRPTGGLVLRSATVKTVTNGAAADGNAQVQITLGADDIYAPYVGATPVAGSTVQVLLQDGSPLIIGRLLGLPNF